MNIRRNKRMASHRFITLTQKGLLMLIMIVWISAPGEGRGGTLYKCVDKDGDVIITDNPLPEFKSVPGHPAEMTEEQRLLLEKKEKEIEMDVYRQITDDTKAGKQGKIRAAGEDLERAKLKEESYRLNIEQTTDSDKRIYWRDMWDKQKKVVEENQQKLNELQSEP
jgi:hypothetical protein